MVYNIGAKILFMDSPKNIAGYTAVSKYLKSKMFCDKFHTSDFNVSILFFEHLFRINWTIACDLSDWILLSIRALWLP